MRLCLFFRLPSQFKRKWIVHCIVVFYLLGYYSWLIIYHSLISGWFIYLDLVGELLALSYSYQVIVGPLSYHLISICKIESTKKIKKSTKVKFTCQRNIDNDFGSKGMNFDEARMVSRGGKEWHYKIGRDSWSRDSRCDQFMWMHIYMMMKMANLLKAMNFPFIA